MNLRTFNLDEPIALTSSEDAPLFEVGRSAVNGDTWLRLKKANGGTHTIRGWDLSATFAEALDYIHEIKESDLT